MIGKKIRKLRLQLGLSQTQLAGKEMTRSYISLIEKGKATPSEKTLAIIAQRLGKPVEYFLNDESEEEDDNYDISIALLDVSQKKLKEKNWKSAIKIANRILSMTQDSLLLYEAYCVIAEAKTQMGNNEQALKDYERALELILPTKNHKKIVQLYMKIGKITFYMEEFDRAKEAYQNAVKYSSGLKSMQEQRTDALMLLGTCLLRLGNINQAIDTYYEALKECEYLNDNVRYGKISMGLGKAYYLNQQIDNAIKWTRTALNLFKPGTEYYILLLHNLAVMECNQGFFNHAYEKFQQCLKWYRENNRLDKQALLLENIAEYWIKRRDYEKAKKMCKDGLKILDKKSNLDLSARFYRLLGIIHQQTGDKDQAYYFYRMSYDLLMRLRASREAEISKKLLDSIEDSVEE